MILEESLMREKGEAKSEKVKGLERGSKTEKEISKLEEGNFRASNSKK